MMLILSRRSRAGTARCRRSLVMGAASSVLLCAVVAGALLHGAPDIPLGAWSGSGNLALQKRWAWAGRDAVSYELGTIQVPENRVNPQSRSISIAFVRIPANPAATGAPPVFLLPGGPGDSYVEAFTARGRRWLELSGLRRAILRFREAGEIILIDQRGNSQIGERLRFAYHPEDLPFDQPSLPAIEFQADVRTARAAVDQHRGKDLSGYTIEACAGDVDALRRALGYKHINLFGLSFGSQWSFAVMRLFPGTIQRALLSGVEPLDASFDKPGDVVAALHRIARAAEIDPALKPHIPQGGLFAAIDTVFQRIERSPVSVKIASPEGRVRNIVLGTGDLQKYMLHDAVSWPARMLALYHGDYRHWARSAINERAGGRSDTASLLAPLIDANLGVSRVRETRLRNDPATRYLGLWSLGSYRATRPVWPIANARDAFRVPVPISVPTLIVHGDWDISTPIENSLRIRPYFDRVHMINVHRGSHGAVHELADQHPEVMRGIVGFLRTGTTAGLPSRVSVALPHFAVPAPAPR